MSDIITGIFIASTVLNVITIFSYWRAYNRHLRAINEFMEMIEAMKRLNNG